MAAKTRRAGRSASGTNQAIRLAGHGLWLSLASAASFMTALVSSESMHYRTFWPELLAVVSLALLMGAVMSQVAGVVRR